MQIDQCVPVGRTDEPGMAISEAAGDANGLVTSFVTNEVFLAPLAIFATWTPILDIAGTSLMVT